MASRAATSALPSPGLRPDGFQIGAHDLLLIGDVADFFRGAAAFRRQQGIGDARFARKKSLDARAGGILARAPDQGGAPAQRRDIARDIARPAQCRYFAFHRQHRHRRFRRDAGNARIDKAVEHDIAHHQHPRIFEAGEKLERTHVEQLSNR